MKFSEVEKSVNNKRDSATCDADAGAPPCHLINFSKISTAREFHLKMENLYFQWLKLHCNQEFSVHFEALLKRMRNSLFCDDGGQSDHDGYIVSPPPPDWIFILISYRF